MWPLTAILDHVALEDLSWGLNGRVQDLSHYCFNHKNICLSLFLVIYFQDGFPEQRVS